MDLTAHILRYLRFEHSSTFYFYASCSFFIYARKAYVKIDIDFVVPWNLFNTSSGARATDQFKVSTLWRCPYNRCKIDMSFALLGPNKLFPTP